MTQNSINSGFLSVVVPGLGHIYCGESYKGAAILAAAILIGNINIIFLPVFVLANPISGGNWAYWIPRIGHIVLSIWSIIFWGWAVWDAQVLIRRKFETTHG